MPSTVRPLASGFFISHWGLTVNITGHCRVPTDKKERDVLNDIGFMLENLSSELEAMIDVKTE